jgi:hypothetical protein
MLVSAVLFWQVVTAIHIIAVVGAYGFVVVFPFVTASVGRLDPRSLATLHRTRQQFGRLLVNPGLALILVSGIYLASDLHYWKQFFVQWGIAMVVVLGGLEGAVVMRQERKLADMAETEAATSAGAVTVAMSTEYIRARNLSQWTSWLMAGLVVVTIYLMSVHA